MLAAVLKAFFQSLSPNFESVSKPYYSVFANTASATRRRRRRRRSRRGSRSDTSVVVVLVKF
jgi:hypothetical protein